MHIDVMRGSNAAELDLSDALDVARARMRQASEQSLTYRDERNLVRELR
jgi:hypothetical protein